MKFMRDTQHIITACWIIFLVYWVIQARFVKETHEKAGGIGGYWHWVLVAMAFFFMENTSIYPLKLRLLPNPGIGSVFSIASVVIGLVIAILARRTLAANWSGSVTFKKGHKLITTGIYHYIRHPIYTGILLMFTGSGVLAGSVGAILGFVVLVGAFWLKLQQEEELMTRHFPKEYPPYKSKTKALIPFVV